MPKILEEWYCTKSGGGCGGYILITINTAINGIVQLICPNCKHAHQRSIENGVIKDNGRFSGNPAQDICPTMPAWSEKPRLKSMQDKIHNERDGAVAKSKDDFVTELWLDRFGSSLGV